MDHAFGDDGKVAVHNTHLDDGGMVNHSDNPSLATNNDDDYSYSTRDIQIGEELTEDYRTYDHVPFFEDLCKKYGRNMKIIITVRLASYDHDLISRKPVQPVQKF